MNICDGPGWSDLENRTPAIAHRIRPTQSGRTIEIPVRTLHKAAPRLSPVGNKVKQEKIRRKDRPVRADAEDVVVCDRSAIDRAVGAQRDWTVWARQLIGGEEGAKGRNGAVSGGAKHRARGGETVVGRPVETSVTGLNEPAGWVRSGNIRAREGANRREATVCGDREDTAIGVDSTTASGTVKIAVAALQKWAGP